MAQVISINEISDNLLYYIQSGNLNFIIGSGASFPAISLAGDIESTLDDLIEEEKMDEADFASLKFIQELENQNDLLTLGLQEGDWQLTLDRYSVFLQTIDTILYRRKSNLLPRQANIFTTNYDTFFEESASRAASLIINDGFDRTSSLNGSFKFTPERYFDRIYRSGSVYTRQAEVPAINLIKMHGSLTWRRFDKNIRYASDSPKVIDLEGDVKNEDVRKSLDKRAIILPNFKKHGSTVIDRTYYDLLRLFANSLETENALLIAFGFSFCDEHLRDVTLRSLRNPTSQMIIFAYNQLDVEQFEEFFDGVRNIIIVAPTEDSATDFEKFNDVLKDAFSPKSNTDE